MFGRRNIRPTTIRSYRDALKLFLQYAAAACGRPVTRLRCADLTARRGLDFLRDIESVRGCGIATRSQRLAEARSFLRYWAGREHTALAEALRVEAIPVKHSAAPETGYLDRDQVQALFQALPPASSGPLALRDRAVLLFLYNSGARVQEAATLRIADLDLESPARAAARQGGQMAWVPAVGGNDHAATTALHGAPSDAAGAGLRGAWRSNSDAFGHVQDRQAPRAQRSPWVVPWAASRRTRSGTPPRSICLKAGWMSTSSGVAGPRQLGEHLSLCRNHAADESHCGRGRPVAGRFRGGGLRAQLARGRRLGHVARVALELARCCLPGAFNLRSAIPNRDYRRTGPAALCALRSRRGPCHACAWRPKGT